MFVHGISSSHVIPCSTFSPLSLRAGISLVKGSNFKADYFTTASVNYGVQG